MCIGVNRLPHNLAGEFSCGPLSVVGLVAGTALTKPVAANATVIALPTLTIAIIGGLLVGFGTALSHGCTSGHGICGISRFSVRSIVATLTFMVVAIITVFITHRVLGG